MVALGDRARRRCGFRLVATAVPVTPAVVHARSAMPPSGGGEASARYAIADEHDTSDRARAVGKVWATGQAMMSSLRNLDRPSIRSTPTAFCDSDVRVTIVSAPLLDIARGGEPSSWVSLTLVPEDELAGASPQTMRKN